MLTYSFADQLIKGAVMMVTPTNSETTSDSMHLGIANLVQGNQCRGFVTNGSNHWILCQPEQVSNN